MDVATYIRIISHLIKEIKVQCINMIIYIVLYGYEINDNKNTHALILGL